MSDPFRPLFVPVDVDAIKRDECAYLDDFRETVRLLCAASLVTYDERSWWLFDNVVVRCPPCAHHGPARNFLPGAASGTMGWSAKAKLWLGVRHDHRMTAREMLRYVRDGYIKPAPTAVPGDGVPISW